MKAVDASEARLGGQVMQVIAHRVFRDAQPLYGFDPEILRGFDGAELDLRCDAEGGLIVRHAPVFGLRCGARRAKAFDATLRALQDAPSLRTLFLDVKSEQAARAAAALDIGRTARDVVFACWGAAEATILRRAAPGARIYYVAAPIFLKHAPRGGLRELSLSNSFPFLRKAVGRRPDDARRERHSINIKLIACARLAASMPRAANGICVHRMFRSPMLDAFIARRGLGLAVYGFGSRAAAETDRRARGADYAIVSAPRRASASPSRDRGRFGEAVISHA